MIDGTEMWSVSGGGHWGGGLFVDALDLARFGLLYLNNGRWNEQQILSEDWVVMTAQACPIEPRYGFMWWLNTEQELWPAAPAGSFAARGGGDNLLWIDPDNDLVVAVRWIQRGTENGLLEHVVSALRAD